MSGVVRFVAGVVIHLFRRRLVKTHTQVWDNRPIDYLEGTEKLDVGGGTISLVHPLKFDFGWMVPSPLKTGDPKEIVARRYQAAHFFEDMLRLILKEIAAARDLSPRAKQALDHSVRANLEEEIGQSGDYGGEPHSQGRRQLLEALGYDYERWVEGLGTYDALGNLHPSAEYLVSGLRGLVKIHPIVGVAVLMHYEDRISFIKGKKQKGDYPELLGTLEDSATFRRSHHGEPYPPDHPLYHLWSHSQHDVRHAQLALDGLLTAVGSWRYLKLILLGLFGAEELITKFWKEVATP